MMFGLYFSILCKGEKKDLKTLGCGGNWFYLCVAFNGRCLRNGIIADLWGIFNGLY
jgi:hypothetical protein